MGGNISCFHQKTPPQPIPVAKEKSAPVIESAAPAKAEIKESPNKADAPEESANIVKPFGADEPERNAQAKAKVESKYSEEKPRSEQEKESTVALEALRNENIALGQEVQFLRAQLSKVKSGASSKLPHASSFHRPNHYIPSVSSILYDPCFNKSTAFTPTERDTFRLRGLLPPRMEDINAQVQRCLAQFRNHPTPLHKYTYLSSLLNSNQTVFYRLLLENLSEMLPIVYTPTVGEACIKFGNIFWRTQGMYISADDKGSIESILDNWPVIPDIIVVTDGSRILGLGDLGVNGMGIPIGKLSVYVAGAGFHPGKTLPITLDLGTNNQTLINDALYLGRRVPRLKDEEFFDFMEELMMTLSQKWPNCLIQFEDFSSENAFALLEKYRERMFCFNDDIQGTGAVILAGILNACRVTKVPLTEHRFVFFGAGSAGVGVADMIVSYLVMFEKVPLEVARGQFYFVDTKGLVTLHRPNEKLAQHKVRFARNDITDQYKTLIETVRYVKPSVLLGLSTTYGAFTEEVIREMSIINERPIVFPLSNPTSKAECTAAQAYEWSDGRVVFASGSPFDPVEYQGKVYTPGQGNNMLIFPGLGLGASAVQATKVTDRMILKAASTLAFTTKDEEMLTGNLYPNTDRMRDISLEIAVAVGQEAFTEGVASIRKPDDLSALIKEQMYYPDYLEARS